MTRITAFSILLFIPQLFDLSQGLTDRELFHRKLQNPELCIFKQELYENGETVQIDACEKCICKNGFMACERQGCPKIRCVNPIKDSSKCCEDCPEGNNCKVRNGPIIQYGKYYKPDEYTTCFCDENFGVNAVCIIEPPPPEVL